MSDDYISRSWLLKNTNTGMGVIELMQAIIDAPSADVVAVCRCKDCKHRPTKPEKYDDGFDLTFPDEVCPCYCDDDPFYSWYPKDDWFCPNGEHKGGDE